MSWIANARMYNVTPEAETAWKQLFRWLAGKSEVLLAIIDHPFPAPLSALWSRPDLAAVFMCGFPFRRADRQPKPVAAPLPSGARYGGRPVYVTDLVIRAEQPWHRLEDSFGGRLGYSAADSHSGFNALRHHLLPYRSPARPQLYRETKGPFVTPRRVLDAVLAGDIDIGPLDGYALDLIRCHRPDLAARIRILDSTAAAPIPFLIASRECPDAEIERLRAGLAEFALDPECAPLRDALCLTGFTTVDLADYQMIDDWDQAAQAAGYAAPC